MNTSAITFGLHLIIHRCSLYTAVEYFFSTYVLICSHDDKLLFVFQMQNIILLYVSICVLSVSVCVYCLGNLLHRLRCGKQQIQDHPQMPSLVEMFLDANLKPVLNVLRPSDPLFVCVFRPSKTQIFIIIYFYHIIIIKVH